ncbi:hypothetical protein CYLTODRAFT_493343 [Cylindrobasidium torrendii FP15055 ss-10]|uniref:C4-dicarboxylate transporter/malic acid transport protein n=1 Tax=Cylindrobasidium torrendii FP15055 ss-10 TaxID=1314674 RepID=A0A0D7B214_9AGAR|nr:hypothetical protein CYLTODRAFT_493343 [Cylindrobasidium torrendii FP15055 ss-10]
MSTWPKANDPIVKVSSVARHIHGWSWATYPVVMGTGAVYLTLSALKDHPPWLHTMEIVFWSISIFIWTLNALILTLQAILFPQRTLRLIQHPVEGSFVPLMALCLAPIFLGTLTYGKVSAGFAYILFWLYVSVALSICLPMLVVWFAEPHDLTHFTPAYAFLIFPMMLVGVVAFSVIRVMDPTQGRTMGVLLVGYFFQGLGFFMTFFYLCIYVMKIMTTGIYEGHQANAAFIVCGPPGFTAFALINLSKYSRQILASQPDLEISGEMWYSTNVLAALMLYGLAIYFFAFDVLPYWNKLHRTRQGLDEILGYWALTFPNVGWIQATRSFGDVFGYEVFNKIHLIMTIIICCIWGILVVLTAKAFWKRKILISSADDVLKDAWLWPRRPAGTGPVLVHEDLESAVAFQRSPMGNGGPGLSSGTTTASVSMVNLGKPDLDMYQRPTRPATRFYESTDRTKEDR